MGTLPAAFAGAFSVFDPPLSETPSTHPQAPEKSRNRKTKNQDPNTKEIPSSKLQTAARASSLELGAWSFSGAWSLVFGALIGGLPCKFYLLRLAILCHQ